MATTTIITEALVLVDAARGIATLKVKLALLRQPLQHGCIMATTVHTIATAACNIATITASRLIISL